MNEEKMKKVVRRALTSALLVSLSAAMTLGVDASFSTAAAPAGSVQVMEEKREEVELPPPGGVSVFINGGSFERERCVVSDGVTRVPFGAFCRAVTGGEAVVSWDKKHRVQSAEFGGMTVTAKVGDAYIEANGRVLYGGYESRVDGEELMVAVRPLAKAFSLDVEWIDAEMRVNVSGKAAPVLSGNDFYDKDELFWLSRIISAEARGEPMEGKLAVGTVVYNRVDWSMYPDTVYGVIFDMKHGIQFTPAYSGSVYREPTAESVKAAKICMEGFRTRDDILFFCASSIRKTCWAGRNRPYIMTIANASFFA